MAKRAELFDDDVDYKKAIRFADNNYRIILYGYDNSTKERISEQKRIEAERFAELKQEMTDKRKKFTRYQGVIDAGRRHTVALISDGTVDTAGENDYSQGYTNWRNIIAIAAGNFHTVGLKLNKSVVAVGAKGDYFSKSSGVSISISCDRGQCDTDFLKNVGLPSEEQKNNGRLKPSNPANGRPKAYASIAAASSAVCSPKNVNLVAGLNLNSSAPCHLEQSEGSPHYRAEILRYAQDDMGVAQDDMGVVQDNMGVPRMIWGLYC